MTTTIIERLARAVALWSERNRVDDEARIVAELVVRLAVHDREVVAREARDAAARNAAAFWLGRKVVAQALERLGL